MDRVEQELLPVHGAGTVVGGVGRGAHPLEVTHHVASNARTNVGSLRDERRPRDHARDRLRQVIWRRRSQSLVDVREMLAVELVEIAVVGGMMFGTVPPVPVAA